MSFDPFSVREPFETGSGKASIYRLSKLQDAGLGQIDKMPFSIRVFSCVRRNRALASLTTSLVRIRM